VTSAVVPSPITVGQPASSHRGLRIPLLLIGVLVLIALAAPVLAPYSPESQLETITMKSLAPSAAHPFGTDPDSRDVLSRVIYGSRVSLAVATLSALVALSIGVGFGALAALGGRLADSVMMRVLDVLLALPRLLILLAIAAFWRNQSVVSLAILIGATGWHDIARLVHGEIRTLASRDFIVAADAAGVGRIRIFFRHLLPHLVPLLAVSASLTVASSISLEAGLSYLGLGVQDQVSWGTIMQDGLGVVDTQWWLTIFPGLAALVAVIACNALGEALRDRFARRQLDA
jgi:peptide/nickel transport system permease protein